LKKLFIPEAIQTSAMDCGPASLKALLEGFGIRASYGRLREACQTDVDGTSIDQLEDAARQLGLDATQVMLPVDHLFAPEADSLPAIVVVRQPNGSTHFVVAWRRHGPWVQVMDPAVGRRWTSGARLARDVYEHAQPVPGEAWREWAGSDSFLKPLRGRIKRLGAQPGALVEEALKDEGPRALARLDAAVRMTDRLVAAGALGRGREAERFLRAEVEIPEEYWSAGLNADGTVQMRGAVLVQAQKRLAERTGPLSPELAAALAEKPSRPGADLLRALREDGLAAPLVTMLGLLAAAAGVAIEAVLLRGFFDLGRELETAGQRAAALGALAAFSALLLFLDFQLGRSVLRIGRRLEARLRLKFLEKIPRLTDRYFQSRPISDMGERCHNVHMLRQGPELAATFLRSVFGMAFTVAAIGWLYPESLWPAALVAAIAIGVPVLAQPALAERDLKVRSHSGALTRYYLDALLGLTAIRAHAAEQAIRGEQVTLLGEWARAGFALQKTAVAIEGAQFGLSLAASVWLVWTRLAAGGEPGSMLLLIYWVLNLPVMGEEAAAAVWQYPLQRNTALRLLEPLGAPEEHAGTNTGMASRRLAPRIRLEEVTVRAAGITILENISVEIRAGEHVAIVGSSGAGKSSLVGLLLGWHRAAAGSVMVDGEPIDVEALRPYTAWVDPQVQLWNRSLFDNLRYGAGESAAGIDEVLDQAELRSVLRRLPDGLQTALGEGGALVSGGEGQRVRLGRAMMRRDVRLAILDEPARGLDRGRRRAMIERARERWREATVICITHDVEDTDAFERVLVVERGGVVEDGSPAELAARPESRYRQLLDAEHAVRRGLWASACWRRLWVEGGKVEERQKRGAHV
jgi:ABC-type bacteriocin/lantibiotic exporter with double-glycine peptidase domain